MHAAEYYFADEPAHVAQLRETIRRFMERVMPIVGGSSNMQKNNIAARLRLLQ